MQPQHCTAGGITFEYATSSDLKQTVWRLFYFFLFIYLLQLGCHLVAVVILHVN